MFHVNPSKPTFHRSHLPFYINNLFLSLRCLHETPVRGSIPSPFEVVISKILVDNFLIDIWVLYVTNVYFPYLYMASNKFFFYLKPPLDRLYYLKTKIIAGHLKRLYLNTKCNTEVHYESPLILGDILLHKTHYLKSLIFCYSTSLRASISFSPANNPYFLTTL